MTRHRSGPFAAIHGTQQQLDELGMWLRGEIGKRRTLRTTWHGEIAILCEDLCMIKCADAQYDILENHDAYPVEGEALHDVCIKAWANTIKEIHQQFDKIKRGE